MTRTQEVRCWRRIGRAFERLAETGKVGELAQAGLCRAAMDVGLPSYGESGSRMACADHHGVKWYECERWGAGGNLRRSAAHRALTAYLIAEMVADGLAPKSEGEVNE